MSEIAEALGQLWRDEDAPTSVEYALMVAFIAAVIIGSVTLLGASVDATFNMVAGKVAP